MRKIHKRDRYYRKRGATAAMFEIACSQCGTLICEYQKDGTGNLHRLYLDRIIKASSNFQIPENEKGITKKQMQNLICACDNMIAVPMLYKKEGRLAYRLIHGTVHKTKIK